MADQNHNPSCGCKEHDHRQVGAGPGRFCLRWIFCILFIIVSFYFIRPLLVAQLMRRASTYMSSPLREEAIREYKKAIFFDRNNSDAYQFLGYAYQSKKDIARAKLAYQEAIKLNPKNTAALFNLGMIYFIDKNYKEAIGNFNFVVGFGPESQKKVVLNLSSYHHSSLRILADCYEGLNQKTQEKADLQKLLGFYPNDEKAKDKLRQIQ
jgi:tetratricopeptide (TPR) repeat protein